MEVKGFALDTVRDHGKARLHLLRYEGGAVAGGRPDEGLDGDA